MALNISNLHFLKYINMPRSSIFPGQVMGGLFDKQILDKCFFNINICEENIKQSVERTSSGTAKSVEETKR